MIGLWGALLANAQNSVADKVLGTWLNEDKSGTIEIYKQGDKYFGKIISGKDMLDVNGKQKTDVKNPKPELRARTLQNLVFLTNFVYGDGKWTDGEIYDPNSGKTYSANMKLDGDKLNIRGYIGISLLGRSTTWYMAK